MDRLRVVILTPRSLGGSETFIRAHVECLPGDVHHLFEGTGGLFKAGSASPLRLQVTSWGKVSQSVFRPGQDRKDPFSVALEDYLKGERIDVVLAEYGVAGVRAMAPCRQAGVPLVVHFHGYDAYKESLVRQMGSEYRMLFDSASAVVVVSRHMAGQLRALGAPEEKLRVVPYGVDMGRFAGAAPDEAPPRFLAVGRFVNKKAPLLTLFAFKQVVEQAPDAQLVMIGDGPLHEAAKQVARHLGIADRVRLPGAVSHEEVAEEMRRARVFVQHSIRAEDGDCEGTPVAILEANATGLPVVSTRHTGIPEIVVEGKTGYLVDEGDVDGMAGYMIRLFQDARLAAELGQAGRERISTEYSLEKHTAALWQVVVDSSKPHT